MEGGVVDKEAPEQGKEQFQTPPQYGASIQEQLTTLAKQEEEQAEKSEEADLALFREFWKEEEEHAKKNTDETAEKAAAWLQAGVNDIFTKSSSAMDALRREKVEKFESLLEKRRQNRVARQDSRRKVFLELVQKHLVAKKDMQTEQKIRRNRLENAQQIPLADRFDDENVFGSLQFTNGGANVADVDLHFAATHDTEETEEVPAFFDKDLPAKDVPPIKSAFKTPRPKPTLFGRFVGSTQKKKRASFGSVNQVKFYTPPNPDDKKDLYNDKEPQKFNVVVADMPVYKDWRRYHDVEFIKKFDQSFETLRDDPDAAIQILYAAHVANILGELDLRKLRQLCMTIFRKYKRSFPKLVDKQGRSNKSVFLAYVKKRLDSHALDLLDEEEDLDNRKYVFTDFQDDFEREHKKHEFEHLKTP